MAKTIGESIADIDKQMQEVFKLLQLPNLPESERLKLKSVYYDLRSLLAHIQEELNRQKP